LDDEELLLLLLNNDNDDDPLAMRGSPQHLSVNVLDLIASPSLRRNIF
jgi:hypothetical protein